MNLLYGVTGEGMGHATRSKVVITYLRSRGHRVLVAASGRAYAMLRACFPDVIEIAGLELAYADGALDLVAAIARNAMKAPAALAHNLAAFAAVDAFAPAAVFSDFDSFAYAYAKARGLPIASVDNMQVIDRCVHDPCLLREHAADAGPASALVALKLPACDRYIVTTFFYPPLRPSCAATTTLVPPIVRAEIVAARPTHGEHVVVYQTAAGDSRLLDALAAYPRQRFIVYGLGARWPQGNVQLKAFDERGFVDDLASARAVVANGGMSLLGECVYLGKPVYSVPVRRHFEQAMNAHYLAAMGYGATSSCFDAATLGGFLRDVPRFAAHLRATACADGNRVLYRAVDETLALLARRRAETGLR